jgi:hypothetical protein
LGGGLLLAVFANANNMLHPATAAVAKTAQVAVKLSAIHFGKK